MQDKAAACFDRPALEHLHAASARRQLNEIGSADDLELHQQVWKTDMRRRLIDDDAHGALRRVCTHVNQAAREALIAHRRHGNQHLTVEVTAFAAAPSLRFGARSIARRIVYAAGRRWSGFALQSWFATGLHVEMLPDCR